MSELSEQYREVQIIFTRSVPAGTGYTEVQRYPIAGEVIQVMFHFPPGCSGLVDMALKKDEHAFFPLTGYLALDDATPIHSVNVEYYANEPFTLEVRNRDSLNAHQPTCTVTVRFKKPRWMEM